MRQDEGLMPRGVIIGIVLCTTAVLPVVSWVIYASTAETGSTRQGSVEIQPGDFYQVPFTVWYDYNEVGYDFTVESGPAVDVYILSNEDYNRYQAGIAVQDRRFVYENTRSVSESPYLPRRLNHAVIDNSNYGVAAPGGSVVVSYSVRPGGPPEVVLQRVVLLAVAGVISVVMLVTGVTLIIRRQRIPPASISESQVWPGRQS